MQATPFTLAVTLLTWLVTASQTSAFTNLFTYQGRLTEFGAPANALYDLRFRLYTAASLGSQVGNTLTNANVALSDGLFIAHVDFGAGTFDGADRWMEVAVRPAGSAGTSPR